MARVPSIVSPMVSPWDLDDVQRSVDVYVEFEQKKDEFVREGIPLVTGTIFASPQILAGMAWLAFAPPPWRIWAVPLLSPGPFEAAMFALGYYWGTQIEEQVPSWLI